MTKHTQQKVSLIDERDSSPLGFKVEPPYFFGAYDKFQQVKGDPFATEGWINHCQALINKWNSNSIKSRAIYFIKNLIKKILRIPISQNSIVEHIRELLQNKEEISILDVGGGFGDNFFQIEKGLGSLSKRVNYLVVDNQVQCSFGIEFYKDKGKKIDFKTEIPNNNFDLIIIIGTIQYIEKWKEFISEITKKSNISIFISRTPINITGPTFVTVQSICPALGPSALTKIGESNLNVINESELHQEFEKNGFQIDKSLFIRDYSDNFKRLPAEFQNIQYIDKYFKNSN
jgi:putative methyltransferase (TIGR04325 family)